VAEVKAKVRRVAGFLGLRRSILAMLLMAVFVGLGEKMAERFLPIYLIALGGTPIVIGLLNGLDNLLSALYSYPGGWLADKLGYKKALYVFNGMAILGYLIVVIFPVWYAVIIGALFFIAWTAISLPATMNLVSSVLPKNKHTMGISMHSMIRRIPMALGPVIGGFFIVQFGRVQGVRYAFLAAIFFAMVALFVQRKYIEDNNGLSAIQFGALTAIEMVTAMLIYVPVAYLADKGTRKPYIAITFFNFTMFPLVLAFCHNFTAFVIAFIIRGLKEFGEPTRKSLILALAPEGAKAGTFGTYYLIRDVIVSVAAFGGAWLWKASPHTNFFIATAFGALGLIYFILRVKTK
jgi:MFS family permease